MEAATDVREKVSPSKDVVWDGPAALGVVAAASITVGILLFDWLVLTTPPGSQTTRTFWWMITNAQTEAAGIADQLVFHSVGSGPWLHLLAAGAVVWLLATLGRHRRRPVASGIAGAATTGALIAGYIAWRTQEGADQSDSIIETLGESAALGPGPYLTIGGFLVGAAAATWTAARR